MKALLSALLLLTLPASVACGQVFSGIKPYQPLTLSWPQQVRVAIYVDSLQQDGARAHGEAKQLQAAVLAYRVEADASRAALTDERRLRENDQANVQKWRQRARRRGLLNWLGLAVAGGVGYLLIAH